MCVDQLVVDQFARLFLRQQVNLVDLVAGAETVEEMQERHARRERRHVRNHRHVLRLLHTRGGKQREARRARTHHIAVIAEDRQRVRRERARGDVEHRRRQLAGDLEHVGQLQQQPLRRGKGRRQRARLERAVHRARGPGLALHLDDLRHLSPQILRARGRPCIGQFTHRRRRRDRVDRNDFAQQVSDAGGGLVAVEHIRMSDHGSLGCHVRATGFRPCRSTSAEIRCSAARRARVPRRPARDTGHSRPSRQEHAHLRA